MKAKRAKRFRKIMNTYQMHFGFREPYQVLLSSDCLRAIHAFAMPMKHFLENTLSGQVHPYITQCTLAKVMEGFSGKGKDGRPQHLPPPTDVPLRYCKHKDAEGNQRGIVPEVECLFDLVSGQVKGNEQRKNKQHFILAAADWNEGIKDEKQLEKLEKERRKRMKEGHADVDVRQHARMVPGVPIIYVKKSVMELEQPSVASERVIRGIEKEKYKDGIGGATRGTKRGREDDSDEEEVKAAAKALPRKKTKGVNPLSNLKKKVKPRGQEGNTPGDASSTKKRRRAKRTKSTAAPDPPALADGDE